MARTILADMIGRCEPGFFSWVANTTHKKPGAVLAIILSFILLLAIVYCLLFPYMLGLLASVPYYWLDCEPKARTSEEYFALGDFQKANILWRESICKEPEPASMKDAPNYLWKSMIWFTQLVAANDPDSPDARKRDFEFLYRELYEAGVTADNFDEKKSEIAKIDSKMLRREQIRIVQKVVTLALFSLLSMFFAALFPIGLFIALFTLSGQRGSEIRAVLKLAAGVVYFAFMFAIFSVPYLSHPEMSSNYTTGLMGLIFIVEYLNGTYTLFKFDSKTVSIRSTGGFSYP